MIKEKSIVVSLIEPILLVKQTFLGYISMLIQKQDNRVSKLGKVLDYDHVPYFTALLNDIFNDSTKIGDIPPSTSVLINDGMDIEYAKELSTVVFKVVVDTIVVYAPEIDFTSDGYRFSLCEDYDLYITPPYLEEERL